MIRVEFTKKNEDAPGVRLRPARGGNMRLTTLAAVLYAAAALAACTTAEAINRPDGSKDYVIACGAAVGWNICYSRANEVCSTGYKTTSQDGGFNRKELTISCPMVPIAA